VEVDGSFRARETMELGTEPLALGLGIASETQDDARATHERTFRRCGERCLKCPFRHKALLVPTSHQPRPPSLAALSD